MGKKSRRKKERKKTIATDNTAFEMEDPVGESARKQWREKHEAIFQKHVKRTQSIIAKYDPFDAALSIAISDVWPPNIASPIKHIFAWAILVNIENPVFNGQRIATYKDFKTFLEALYAAWPEFPMMEDFVAESDWGEIRAQLGDDFVRIFYGSCLERTPDFIDAFRITFADNTVALADMDLALAIQNHVITSISVVDQHLRVDVNFGHIEVPPEEFWSQCREAFIGCEKVLANWRTRASGYLDATPNDLKPPLTSDAFGDACMQGLVLPLLGLIFDNRWLPINIRNAPANVIDFWSNRSEQKILSFSTHRALAWFCRERFEDVIPGPLKIYIDEKEFSLPVSCVLNSGPRLFILCACSHNEIDVAEKSARAIYNALRRNKILEFKLANGSRAVIANRDGHSPTANEISIILVPIQSGTALGFRDAPKWPVRLMFLADVITIFDDVQNLDELEKFWQYVDDQKNTLSPFSRAASDLFASFRDTHQVLVDGAVAPTFIALDPHWASSWRFRELSNFWGSAPRRFPNGSAAWLTKRTKKGVAEIRSRYDQKTWAYSVEIGECTVQFLMSYEKQMGMQDGRMVDLFLQAASDCLLECRELISELPIFKRPQIIFRCVPDPEHTIDEQAPPDTSIPISLIITSSSKASITPFVVDLQVNPLAISAGLMNAIDASFEIACLIEILDVLHNEYEEKLPAHIEEKIRSTAKRPARYHLRIVNRTVDVPDFGEPIIPTSTEYKRARRQLALSMKELGFNPGRYELAEAKIRIDGAKIQLQQYIEARLAQLNPESLIYSCIEQNDKALYTERFKIQRVQQSLSHEVDYDRIEAINEAKKEYGAVSRHYRYLLEKMLSSADRNGIEEISEEALRELLGLIDWYFVLAGASDVLHNEVDIGGVDINDSYTPEIFYSEAWETRDIAYSKEYGRSKLGLGLSDADSVEGNVAELLNSDKLCNAFRQDLGFELKQLLQSLLVLSQPVAHGLVPPEEMAFSYAAPKEKLPEWLCSCIENLSADNAAAIVQFLMLSSCDIRRLSGRTMDEGDVPFWEHSKRLHRYTIRPLIADENLLRWGAEHVSRTMNIWSSAIRDGYLPAEFPWPEVNRQVKEIKETIEKQLEIRAEQICLRFTPHVVRGVDFYRRFRKENFEDVGDFDVLAYWPKTNILIAIECKYNSPPYSFKDSRRLRDRIFGSNETDRNGQLSRISRRRHFLISHRARMIELLRWPVVDNVDQKNLELYVSRDIYWWMVHPPYLVPTQFIRIDALDSWLKHLLSKSSTSTKEKDFI